MKKRTLRHILILISLFICVLSLAFAYRATSTPSPLNRVAVWMPTSWDRDRARAAWTAYREDIDELSPVWYQLDASGDGSINTYSGARDQTLIDEVHQQGALIIPLINNSYAGGMDPAPVSKVINDDAVRAAHIQTLVNEVVTYGYDGIDIDYEMLEGTDRDAFSLFIEELAAALHQEGKILSIAVHPKTWDWRARGGSVAQDWSRIGPAVDRFRIMTYGVHWSGSDPGPIAPVPWMRDVLKYATSVVPHNKVYVGIHLYGLNWPEEGGAGSLTWDSAQALLQREGISPSWEETASEPWFTYPDGSGGQREVWYANGASVSARLDLVRDYGLGGIAIWRLGGEDPDVWTAIQVKLHPRAQVYLPLMLRNSSTKIQAVAEAPRPTRPPYP